MNKCDEELTEQEWEVARYLYMRTMSEDDIARQLGLSKKRYRKIYLSIYFKIQAQTGLHQPDDCFQWLKDNDPNPS